MAIFSPDTVLRANDILQEIMSRPTILAQPQTHTHSLSGVAISVCLKKTTTPTPNGS